MYKAIAPSVIKELENMGDVVFSVKNTGSMPQNPTPWITIPHKISFMIGNECEHIFDCLIQSYDNQMYVSNVEAAGILRLEEQGLVDVYLYLTMKKAITFAKVTGKKRLVFDSHIPSTAEHMADLGFFIYPSTAPYRGGYDLCSHYG
jgi:hypothetical protein